jgi:hypothetical protein
VKGILLMSSNRNLQVTIRQYLLGQLTDDGLEQFEQRMFADDNLFEEVLVAEDELIDESLAGKLSQNESALFAKNFLNSRDRKQKLLFRGALKNCIKRRKSQRQHQPVPRPSWIRLFENWSFRTIAACAVAVIVAVALWSSMRPPHALTINLTIAPSVRGPNAPVTAVKLTPDVNELRLHLTLPEPSTPGQSYRVELKRASGNPRILETVARDDKSVDVAIPASQLEPGQYALNLRVTKPGETEQRIAGSYYFTIE